MLLRLSEIIGIVLAALFIVTQLVVPALMGKRLFPLFRKQGKLESELAEAVQEREDAELEKAIKKVRPKSTEPERKD